jgi:hypothetical protein
LGGRLSVAAIELARTAARSPKSSDGRPLDIVAKAAAAARRIAALRADLAAAHDLAHRAQVREAVTRSELTLALGETLRGRAEALAAVRAQAKQLYLARATPQPVRRHGRPARAWDRLLGRLGAPGQIQLILDAGIWRSNEEASVAAYVRLGRDPGAQPDALFDQSWYLATYPDAAGAGVSPLVHYLLWGAAAGNGPHPLLHRNFYHAQNAHRLAATGVSALEHFAREGAALARDPHPAFDIGHYVGQGPDLAPREDPVSHYLRTGWRDGLSPHPLFDPAWYRRQLPRREAEAIPLVHYLTVGWREGLTPHPLFDPRWYLEQYPEVAEAGTEPLTHFLTGGAAEGRNPSPWFDTAHYVAVRGEALDPGANPLVDYVQGGAWAVTEGRPGFATGAYLAAAPEMAAQGLTPLEHWARKAVRS